MFHRYLTVKLPDANRLLSLTSLSRSNSEAAGRGSATNNLIPVVY